MRCRSTTPKCTCRDCSARTARFIEKHLPHIGNLISDDLAGIVEQSDILVIGSGDRGTIDRLKREVGPEKIVVDLVGVGREGFRAKYIGLAWM